MRSAICAALHADGRIETSCPDCGESIAVEVHEQRVDDESLRFPFPGSRRALVGRHRLHLKHDESLPVGRAHRASGLGRAKPGAIIPVAKLSELAHAWLSDAVAPDWQPRSLEQEQAMLDQLGLTGEFWRLF